MSKDYLPLKQVDDTTGIQEQTKSSLNVEEANATEKKDQSSVLKTTLNVLNCMEGVGFLALPYTILQGGIAAVIGFFTIPFISGYTANLLVQCLYETNEDEEKIRVRSSYQEIGLRCWAPLHTVVSVLIGFLLFSIVVSYVVLFSSLMHHTFPRVPLSESLWACIAIAIVLPTVFLEYLSKIAWLSLVGILALLGSVCLCLTYEFQAVNKWDVKSFLFWDTQGAFIAFNILIFSYGLHTVIIPIEGEMADKSKLPVALVSSYCIGGLIKVAFAVVGFLTYTSATNEIILNNLPTGIPTKIIAVLFSASVLLTYPIPVLILTGMFEESWLYCKITNKVHPKICLASFRVGVVLSSLGVAVGLPHFALVMALGGCGIHMVMFIFPGLFHLVIKYNNLRWFHICADCFFIALGVCGLSLGLVNVVKTLVVT